MRQRYSLAVPQYWIYFFICVLRCIYLFTDLKSIKYLGLNKKGGTNNLAPQNIIKCGTTKVYLYQLLQLQEPCSCISWVLFLSILLKSQLLIPLLLLLQALWLIVHWSTSTKTQFSWHIALFLIFSRLLVLFLAEISLYFKADLEFNKSSQTNFFKAPFSSLCEPLCTIFRSD